MKKISLKSLADTQQLAQQLAATLRGGEVLALSGQLGAGKTTFTQALAKALGVKQTVKSPTFTILQTYSAGRLTLCHVDAYRLKSINELEAIGLTDYLGQVNTITIIEWAEKIKKAIPRNATWLKFTLNKDSRTVLIV